MELRTCKQIAMLSLNAVNFWTPPVEQRSDATSLLFTMEHFKDISLKLYSILLSSNDETQEARNLESDDDEDLPRECCYCAELFFEVQNYEKHICIADKTVSKNVNTKHKCSFDGCEKSFGKAGMLRKHEVS